MRPIAGGGIAVEVADEATLSSVRRLVSARPEQLKCAPALRNLLVKEGRLYVGLRSCRVDEYLAPMRCYKCQRFGHHSVRCKAEKPTCGFLWNEGHDFNTFPKRCGRGEAPLVQTAAGRG
ncbi:hypothetical protein PR048_033784 [Dryococelus australis]|uniref:CCHC-type domain-containing protein n=1 Tax=Dryococelus australis TaxID=614101 RepID=A0ABQ9G096_9NEOP|nr:hypothetical protein PR048_033784 [Dryococelus australis]